MKSKLSYLLFFFNETPTTEIYTLSLHDALPISAPIHAISGTATEGGRAYRPRQWTPGRAPPSGGCHSSARLDRKSTRLNASHSSISYAVFCLKKKKKNIIIN